MFRRIKPSAKVVDCGVFGDFVWPGSVSAKKLIADKQVTKLLIADGARQLEDYYVAVNPAAKTRCIDGRFDPALDEARLGPQVPGGAPGAALAYRLGVDKDDLTRGTFLNDAEVMLGSFLRLGLNPGGHRDEASRGTTVAGCGAIDGMDRVLAAMTDPHLVDEHKRVVRLLMGTDFNKDDYLRVLGAAVIVNGRSETYFRNREAILDVLEKRAPHSVAVLSGVHHECIVAVNLVAGTTLSTNRVAEAFNGMQVFGYDLWYSKQIARKLLPRSEQLHDRQRFVMARVMTTVATLMVLTDGSQRILLRLPAS